MDLFELEVGQAESIFNSYSTAITNLTSEKFALSRSLSRLNQVEEELKNHLASLKHEHEMMNRYVRVCPLSRKETDRVPPLKLE